MNIGRISDLVGVFLANFSKRKLHGITRAICMKIVNNEEGMIKNEQAK